MNKKGFPTPSGLIRILFAQKIWKTEGTGQVNGRMDGGGERRKKNNSKTWEPFFFSNLCTFFMPLLQESGGWMWALILFFHSLQFDICQRWQHMLCDVRCLMFCGSHTGTVLAHVLLNRPCSHSVSRTHSHLSPWLFLPFFLRLSTRQAVSQPG